MPAQIMYCPGCNQRFEIESGDANCPHCGQTVGGLANAPTLEFSEINARDVPQPHHPEVDMLIGQRVAQYDVEDVLGQGGMGRVYKARHINLERPCALKVLNGKLVEKNPSYVDLFLSEARAAASLVHPHVVTIHNVGEYDGRHFIEMEYIVGRSLSHLLETKGSLDITDATRLMTQICAALKLAHQAHMVHRDIKPANVLVTTDGDAKLADFGLAKRVAARDENGRVRNLAGTPYFMAPELFSAHPADPRSDVYAMGISYFVLTTGQLPFRARSLPELAIQHELEPVPDLRTMRSDIPDEVAGVIARCLAKQPQERYADAADLYQDLSSVYRGLRSLEELLRAALVGAPVDIQGARNQFTVVVRLPHGRMQSVFVEATEDPVISDRVVRVYSVCGPADNNYFRRALELNAILAHGSIGLESIRGQPHFIMTCAYPKSTCDAEELQKSILLIARHADRMEQMLTGSDAH